MNTRSRLAILAVAGVLAVSGMAQARPLPPASAPHKDYSHDKVRHKGVHHTRTTDGPVFRKHKRSCTYHGHTHVCW